MTIHKLKSIKILGVNTEEYVGSPGTIFYDDETGALKLSDGLTLGGVDISTSSGLTLPPQTGNEGKFLRTNGATLSWVAIIPSDPTVLDGGNASTQF